MAAAGQGRRSGGLAEESSRSEESELTASAADFVVASACVSRDLSPFGGCARFSNLTKEGKSHNQINMYLVQTFHATWRASRRTAK